MSACARYAAGPRKPIFAAIACARVVTRTVTLLAATRRMGQISITER